MDTTVNATRVPMLVRFMSTSSGTNPASSPTKAQTMMVLRTGARVRGSTRWKISGSIPSRPMANRMRDCPYKTTSVTAEDRDGRASGQHGGWPARASDIAHDHREAGLLACELLVGLCAHPGKRHENVECGHDDSGKDDRQREVPAGVVHLLARGRDGVQPDEGEEDRPGGRTDAREPEGRERLKVLSREGREPDDDEQGEDGELDEHHDRVRRRGLPHPTDEQ